MEQRRMTKIERLTRAFPAWSRMTAQFLLQLNSHHTSKEKTVSRRNGDKSRFGRQRKEQIHRRERIRDLRKMMMMKAGQPATESKTR